MSRRIMYLRSSNGHPIGCVAIDYERGTSVVKYNLSVLNPQDDFNRSVARHLAIGRLVEQPITVRINYSDPTVHEISQAVMDDILFYGKRELNFPARAIKAAKLWISKNVLLNQ